MLLEITNNLNVWKKVFKYLTHFYAELYIYTVVLHETSHSIRSLLGPVQLTKTRLFGERDELRSYQAKCQSIAFSLNHTYFCKLHRALSLKVTKNVLINKYECHLYLCRLFFVQLSIVQYFTINIILIILVHH